MAMSNYQLFPAKKTQLKADSEEKLRVAAYCRVSTDEKDQRNSLAAQQAYFEEAFNEHPNWINAGIYADEGISGTSIKKRDKFNEMINLAKHREIDIIITKEVSRFSRNTLDLLALANELYNIGVYIVFINDNINTQNRDQLDSLTEHGRNAQYESLMTSTRVRSGQLIKMKQGIIFGRREMFGFDISVGIDGKQTITPIEKEAEIIREIFKWYSEGDGTSVIARRLERNGIKTKRYKNGWSNTVILRILRNEKYVGDLMQGKTYTPDPMTHKKKYNNDNQSAMVLIKNHHQGIIDRDTWNRVQELLKEKAPTAVQKAKHSSRYWNSGKVVCGICGRRYIRYTKKQKGEKYVAYICSEHHLRGSYRESINEETGEVSTVGCDAQRVNDKVLSIAMHDILSELIKRNKDEIVKKILAADKPNVDTIKTKKDIARIQKQIEKNSQHRVNLIMKWNEGNSSLDQESFNMTCAAYIKQGKELADTLSVLEKKLDSSATVNNNSTKRIDEVERLVSLSNDEINEGLYARVCRKITVYPHQILEFHLSFFPVPIYMQYTAHGRGESYDASFTVLTQEEFTTLK